jgi:hypothetical protein
VERAGDEVCGGSPASIFRSRLRPLRRREGLDTAIIADLLRDASPASAAARTHVDRIVRVLDGPGAGPPATPAERRAISPATARALDDYLDEFAWFEVDPLAGTVRVIDAAETESPPSTSGA